MNKKIMQIYDGLLKAYGPQGWWPLLSVRGTNPTKTGAIRGYHPNDYSYPKTDSQRFEICCGAILTQNTAWPNVEKALLNLKRLNCVNPKKIIALEERKLAEAIKPAGYFNQKGKKLKLFSEFYLEHKGKTPTREDLLSLWGVGPETADSILLYAYKQPVFVVDTYTKRIFSRLGFFDEDANYDAVQQLFIKNLPEDYRLFNEYHALIVEHAKRSCRKAPLCDDCVLKDICPN